MFLYNVDLFSFNKIVLDKLIKDEVSRLNVIDFENFKVDFLKNYVFDDKLLSREEVAEKLNVSIGTVDNLVKRKRLSKCSIGKSVKFRNSDILTYIKNL